MKRKTIGSLILVLLTLVVSTFWTTTAQAAPPKPWPGSLNANAINNDNGSSSVGVLVYDFLNKYGILDKLKLTVTTPHYQPVVGTFDQYYDNYFTPTVNSLLSQGSFKEDLDLVQKLLEARVSFTLDDINFHAGKNEIPLVIIFKNKDLDFEAAAQIIAEPGGKVNKVFKIVPSISVTIERSKLIFLTTQLRNAFEIKSIDVNSRVYTYLDESVPMIFTPGSEEGQRQWIEEKWARGPVDGRGVTIAILDTGINIFHQDLSGTKVAFSKNITPPIWSLYDGNGHGTHVASIAAGTGRASNGRYTGIAPRANLYNIKVFDDEGHAESEDLVVEGIQVAIDGPDGISPGELNDHGDRADIISFSGGFREYPYAYTDEVVERAETAVAEGVVMVVAAGNYGSGGYSTIASPARAPHVITVGAIQKNELLSPISSKGPAPAEPFIENYETPYLVKPDVVAPGVSICAAKVRGGYLDDHNRYGDCDYNQDQYGTLTGTSMATPHVAGAAALILQMHPNWTPAQVKSALVQMARPLYGLGGEYNVFEQGAGLIVIGDSLRFGGEVLPPVINAGIYDTTNPQLPPIEIDFDGRNDNQNGKCYGLKIDSIETTNVDTGEEPETSWQFPPGNLELNALQMINFFISHLTSDLAPGRYATRMKIEYYKACDFTLPEPTKVLQIPIGFFVK